MSQVSWFDARSLAYEAGRASSSRRSVPLALAQAIGATLAGDAHSPLPLPHYDSSAMDGFAVSGKAPWQVVEPVKPADGTANLHRLTVALKRGQATPILTGGLIPPGADAVVRSEQSRREGGLLFPLKDAPRLGADIRRAGEELAQGAVLVSAGTVLSPRHIALLATAGFDEVEVVTPPVVDCALTGNEVISRGIPRPGEVRDAYAPHFPYLLERMGATVGAVARLHDEKAEVAAFIEGSQADFILATGGSAHSDVDILRSYLEEVGARFIFESVLVRPGHPTLLAQLPTGQLVLGLPGNPLAAHTSLYTLFPLLVAGFCHRPMPDLSRAQARNAVSAFAKQSVRLLPCEVTGSEVHIMTRATRSHMLSALASANALAVVLPEGVEVGDTVELVPVAD